MKRIISTILTVLLLCAAVTPAFGEQVIPANSAESEQTGIVAPDNMEGLGETNDGSASEPSEETAPDEPGLSEAQSLAEGEFAGAEDEQIEPGPAPEDADVFAGEPEAIAADNAPTALLYSDGALVFQLGTAPDSAHGTVTATYTGFDTLTEDEDGAVTWPWQDAAVKSVIFKDSIAVKTCAYMFCRLSDLESVDVAKLDTSGVTNMYGMFMFCCTDSSKDVRLDLTGLNTATVTSMDNMFIGCMGISELDISGFDMSKATHSGMFLGCNYETLKLGPGCAIDGTGLVSEFGWVRESTGEVLTSDTLMSTYSSSMADAYHAAREISFYASGATPDEQILLSYIGATKYALPSVEKPPAGKTFKGWYTAGDGGVPLNPGDPILQEAYFAQWDKTLDYLVTIPAEVRLTERDGTAMGDLTISVTRVSGGPIAVQASFASKLEDGRGHSIPCVITSDDAEVAGSGGVYQGRSDVSGPCTLAYHIAGDAANQVISGQYSMTATVTVNAPNA